MPHVRKSGFHRAEAMWLFAGGSSKYQEVLMRKVLVAYDGSDSSKNALRQAVKLAKAENSSMKVLSVMVGSEALGVDVLGHGALKEPALKAMAEAEAIVKSEGYSTETAVAQGIPHEQIVKNAEAEGCGLIVLGRRGLTRLERMLMGSVTARVIGHTDRDVLVVPQHASLGWERVLAATDGSMYGQAAVERAIEFARARGGGVVAVSVVYMTDEFYSLSPSIVERLEKEARETVDGAGKKAEAAKVPFEGYVKEGDVPRSIIELANEKKADVIFLGSHGRHGLSRLLMGSVTEKVIGLASCPVMVVRAAQRNL
jgi:hypothetical protein